jgi:hypothetical protein
MIPFGHADLISCIFRLLARGSFLGGRGYITRLVAGGILPVSLAGPFPLRSSLGPKFLLLLLCRTICCYLGRFDCGVAPFLLVSVAMVLINEVYQELSHVVCAVVSVLDEPLGQFAHLLECLLIEDNVLVL